MFFPRFQVRQIDKEGDYRRIDEGEKRGYNGIKSASPETAEWGKDMKLLKETWNFIGSVVAILLSFALFFVLLAIPAMLTAHAAAEPDTLHQLLIALTVSDQNAADPEGALMQKLMQSSAAKEFLALYKESLFAQLRGEASPLNGEALSRIVRENMEELLPLIQDFVRSMGMDPHMLTEKQLATFAEQLTAYFGDQLLRELPTAKDLGLQPITELTVESIFVIDGETVERLLNFQIQKEDILTVLAQGLILLNDYLGLKLLALLVGVLSLLILVFRLGEWFRGSTWLSVNYLIGGGTGAVIALCAKASVVRVPFLAAVPMLSELLQELLNWFAIGSGVIFLLGILLAAYSAVGGKVVKKIRKRRQWE